MGGGCTSLNPRVKLFLVVFPPLLWSYLLSWSHIMFFPLPSVYTLPIGHIQTILHDLVLSGWFHFTHRPFSTFYVVGHLPSIHNLWVNSLTCSLQCGDLFFWSSVLAQHFWLKLLSIPFILCLIHLVLCSSLGINFIVSWCNKPSIWPIRLSYFDWAVDLSYWIIWLVTQKWGLNVVSQCEMLD